MKRFIVIFDTLILIITSFYVTYCLYYYSTYKSNNIDYVFINTTTKSSTDIKVNELNKENYSKYKKLDYIDGEKKYIEKTSNGFIIEEINNVTYIDGYMIINKTYPLPSNYIPLNTYTSSENKNNTCNTCINIDAYNAFEDMQNDALALGLNIYISSGYRPYKTQQTIYNNYIKRDGKESADTYSARPGYSEHQSGLCFDLNSISDSFANTNEGKWINDNAYKYGFIIRFPKNKQNFTGYKYESWHLRYVGEELANKLYNNGNWISMEEYFGITSIYKE